jgi:hypothetical protein
LIEINWGTPITLVLSPEGGTKKFTTIEQASHWLRKKWPVADRYRDVAVGRIDAAMHCMGTVGSARKAFLAAANTAGFKLDHANTGTTPIL